MSVAQAWMDVVVARRWVEATDIVVIELEDAEGRELPSFSAGAHIDVEVAPGLVRQYSLCNGPTERNRYQIGVLREPTSRGGSAAVHSSLGPGQALRIGAPRNHFPLEAGATRSFLFAGGIGITPILCMAERLHHAGAEFTLHYAARSADRAAFRTRILDGPLTGRATLHVDDGPDEQRLDLAAAVPPHAAGDHLYVCGPAGFIDAVLGAARMAGWPKTALHREYFTAPAVAPGTSDRFEVQIASTGMIYDVGTDDTVADVLERAGIAVPLSCAQGVCGTCVTRILSGVPDHQDLFLTDEEHAANDQFTPCCSRAKSARLVLDL